jgi:hypothetical protein
MGIFGRASLSSIDSNSNISNASTRNRRNSSNTVVSSGTIPVSIVPAPPQNGHSAGTFLKPNHPISANITSNSSVFGRQQSWSDQLADASLFKGTAAKLNDLPSYPPVIPVRHNQNIPYPNNNTTNPSTTSNSSNNDVKFVHSTMEILENQIKREEAPKKKRTRTSTEQLRILQKAFQTDPMPNSGARAALSKKLGMSTRAVQVWFQNRRAKEKLDAKRNMLGLSGTSSFTYVKGVNSDDEEGCSGSGGGNDDDEDFNFEDDESINTETNPVSKNAGGSSSEYLNSMKTNGMMGRMAFSTTSEVPIKAQRSSSTPNGFFQGFPNSAISNHHQGSSSSNSSSSSSSSNRSNQINLGIGGPKSAYTSYFTNLSSNNPLCHLFPGETFISDVNEASVDQLYQDLGGVSSSSVHSPIDDTCAVNFSNQNSASGSSGNTSSSVSAASSSNFFTFGDPFYGGGIIDRTPSVSPVGFGPRSHFYYPICNPNFDFMLPNPHVTNEFNSLDSFVPSNSTTSNACKGISGGNVYLTSSISSNSNSNVNMSAANRRSFSLPEAHGNLTFQQMQQLENFGLQVYPSPLLSINEEKLRDDDDDDNEGNDINKNTKTTSSSPLNLTPIVNNSNSSDFLIPFSDFLEGEVIR